LFTGNKLRRVIYLKNIDIISLILAMIFILPILFGLIRPVTRLRLQSAIASFISNIEFLLGIISSIIATNKLLGLIDGGGKYRFLSYIPDSFKTLVIEQRLIAFIILVPFVLILCLSIIKLLLTPVYKLMVDLIPALICRNDGTGLGAKLLGIVWKLPTAVIFLLIATFALNIYSSFNYNPNLNNAIAASPIYKVMDDRVFIPVKSGEWLKKIPVIQGDLFAKDTKGDNKNLIERIAGKNIKVVEYFNGVTLDEAVKSNAEIDNTAKQLTASENTSIKKAFQIYKWITTNINYDDAKAATLSTNSRGISSGAINAYNERKGVCFDYSSLFIAMCRATGLKVRMVTGLGYSGKDWGDHAWNEVWSEEEGRWVNVDTTFGKYVNYFDRKGFNVDHKYAEIQGEW